VVAIKRAVWRGACEYQPQPSVLADRLVVPTVELPDLSEHLYRAQVRAELYRLVGTLTPRLRQIVVAHYGLADDAAGAESEPRTFAAIGSTRGVTRQRAQQLHVTALLWLAQPAHSLALRRLLERNRRRDYQQVASRLRRAARTRRGYRRLTK